ncbi:PAS domain S-box protein [uncultured Methanolobus sp.]|uniref:PAS domain S-box protein n=1 Tax=uncultured Methanolobus sp. TaxID=218300 RepID=UPI0029C60D21|nr:PAS domain S-box protein [uncultured Methanolobus sp.]
MRYISYKPKAGNAPEKEQNSRRCKLADINELGFQKLGEIEREITIELLNLFNKSNHLDDVICSVIKLLKNWSDCEAVGIRLKDGDDYPYYQTQGFPDSFITSENSLCVHDIDGQVLKDKIGNPVLECMCGNVICERFDPQMPFFTQMGSFWTGATSELLANTSEEERQARTRNRCNGEGYESVALIPLRADKVTFGLIQLNDHRKDAFTAESIALLERIADSIALALTQKKAKEELQLSEKRLKSIFKVAPIGIGVVSNRILTEVNSLVCEMTGYTEEELIGSASRILYPTQEEFEFVGKEKYHQINKKGTGTVETRWKKKDGTIINVLLSSTPIDTSDKSKGVTFTALDITERNQAEISLRESEEKFREQAEKNRAIINTIPDMLFVVDKDGYYKEYYSNDRTKTSYIAERIIGANISDIYPVEEAIRLIKACRECISTNRLQTIEYQFQNNGKKMFFEARLSPIYNNHALAVVRDITETKNSQETLRTIAETGVSFEEDIFRILVRQLAISQNIRYSILAEIHPDDPNTAHTIAVWNGAEYADNFSYELKNTPCKNVTHKGSCFYPSNIQELFPDDHLLKEMKAESYWGTPLTDSAGRSIGLLAILDDRPMEQSANTHSMLKSFAARAAAELERRRTEEALKENEGKFRSYVDNSPTGICAVDREGFFVDVNPAASEITGYTKEELLSMNLEDTFPPEEKDNYKGLFYELLEKGSLSAELPFIRKDGTQGYWAYDAVRLSDELYLVIYNDISDRIIAENMLRSATQRLSIATRSAGIGIWEYDLSNNVLIWDKQMHEMYGTRPGDFSGTYEFWMERVHPLDRGNVLKLLDDALETNKELNTEFRILRPDGEILFIEAHAIMKRDPQGRPLKFIGTNWDITERKKSQDNLKESEGRLGLAMETFGLGFWELDLNRNSIYLSRQMNTMMGLEPEHQFTNLDFYFDCLHPEDMEIVMSELKKAIKQAKSFHLDCRIKHTSGEWIWVSIKGKPFEADENGKTLRFVGTQVDITPRVKAEEALLYSKIVADDVNRIKSEFMKNMSHELRTPLTAVIGFSDVLLNHNSEGLSESQKTYINHIHNSGQNLLGLINKILDFSKYEIDDLETINLKKLSLDTLISEIMMLMSQRASNRNINISFNRKGSIATFYADEDKLTQIIHNLLDNAIKFTNEGGSVSIETSVNNKMLQVSIVDTGIGIENKYIDSIFIPFVQIDGSIARKYSGTGIGLALTKKFVDLHGGNIWVSSEPGKGSNFTFELPINPKGN